MGHKEIVVDGEIFYEEASKFLQTMSVNSKFKIKGKDSHDDLFDYYSASENRCELIFDAEQTNFLHRLDAQSTSALDPKLLKNLQTQFELPVEKIDVGYFFKVEADAGIPPRCEGIHNPHVFRYGNIGFAFLICLPLDWAVEEDHYAIKFNYYKGGKYRVCKRSFSLLNGKLPYVRYMLDEWTWGDEPLDFVEQSISRGNQNEGIGLSQKLANKITRLFYYVNIIWLIENDGLSMNADADAFLHFDDLDVPAKAKLIQQFEEHNQVFCAKCKEQFNALVKDFFRAIKYVDTETLLRHYGIIPVNKSNT